MPFFFGHCHALWPCLWQDQHTSASTISNVCVRECKILVTVVNSSSGTTGDWGEDSSSPVLSKLCIIYIWHFVIVSNDPPKCRKWYFRYSISQNVSWGIAPDVPRCFLCLCCSIGLSPPVFSPWRCLWWIVFVYYWWKHYRYSTFFHVIS